MKLDSKNYERKIRNECNKVTDTGFEFYPEEKTA